MIVALALVFLAGNALFVGAQFALITARRDQIKPLAESGNRRARVAAVQMRALPDMLAGSQLGIAVCSLGLGAVAEPAFAHLLEAGFDAASLPKSVLHPAAFMVALAFVSFCHMVLGEMVPKNLALAGPIRAALWLGPPMAAWGRITRPLLVVINGLANATVRLFRVEPTNELGSSYTAEDLADLFAESTAHGLLEPADQQLLNQALALDHVTARDVLLPLSELVTLPPNGTLRQIERLVATTGYSRYPVRDDGELTGYIHAKDILTLDPNDRDARLPPTIVRPMASIRADATVADALTAMQHADSHIARVSSTAGTLGVILLEDLLEQLIGEIGTTPR